MSLIKRLADTMVLGSLLETLRSELGSYELLDHWLQGEFHHDVLLAVPDSALLPGRFLLVATNCNGGVKEVISLAKRPERFGLWRWRCPNVTEFLGPKPAVLARETTPHWFDPCELLLPNARSELKEEFRERQLGGGWQKKR